MAMKLSEFYQGEKFYNEKCWDTCGGSHCCKISKITQNLKFAPRDSQILHLYDFEVDWLKSNNQLDPEFAKTLVKYQYNFSERSITFYSVQCGYEGLCPNHQYRPISCFLYPYIPYFDASGKVEKLYNLSVYDDIYDAVNEKKPCTLYDKFNLLMYQDLVDKYFKDERFYFLTNVYARVKELAILSFRDKNEESSLDGALQNFEMGLAMKMLVTQKEVSEIVSQEHVRFEGMRS